jgi:Holliday junction resolvase RusA-like endonuclease
MRILEYRAMYLCEFEEMAPEMAASGSLALDRIKIGWKVLEMKSRKPTGEFEDTSWTFAIKEKIPSKKNSYRVRFSKPFWSAVIRIAPHVKVKGSYWIGPSKEVEQVEQIIAWVARSQIKRDLKGRVEVRVVTGTKHDLDNLIGVIFDGMEKSGRIKNDRQIDRLIVERSKKIEGVEVTIRPLPN